MALALAALFWGSLSAVIVPLAIRLLVGVGFGAVSYVGISALLDTVQSQLASYLGALGGSIITILAMARVDDFIAVILSALSAKLILRGVTAAGSISKMQFKGGA